MRLNHLDLQVPDVAATRDFFVTHLGFNCEATKGRDALCILRDESGFVLVLSVPRKDGPQQHPTAFHIGFLLDSEEAVREQYARMVAAGVHLPNPPDKRRGALLFYFHAPGDVLVEVSHRA